MKAPLPVWVVAAGLLLWGASVGVLPFAVPMVLAVVSPAVVKRRAALGVPEFNRALEICWVLILGGLLFAYNREPVGSVLRSFAQWLPLVIFPALLAQLWSERGSIPVGSLFPFPRWRRRAGGDVMGFEMTGAYLLVCVLSASLAGGERPWFYAAAAAITVTSLWVGRAGGSRSWAAAAFLALAVAGGWGVGLGIGRLQGWFENRVLQWASQWRRDDGSLRPMRTAIGSTGRVEGSSRVVLTVRTDGAGEVPPRLRVGTFSLWREGTWYPTGSGFEKVEGSADEWPLDPRPGVQGSLRVELRREATGGFLPLPDGTRVVGELVADEVELTRVGAVRARTRGGVIGYRADAAADADWEGPPTEEERRGIPTPERAAVVAVAAELGLAGLEARAIIDRVGRFFAEGFRYTTDLADAPVADPRATTPVGRFLLGSRSGHCEYFATAGALLLRAAGVPARYATGFSIDPGASDEGLYRVRDRHAHAWVRVWLDGRWHDFDPTPPAAFEAQGRLTALGRAWGNLWFTVARWWWLGEKRVLRQAYWLTVPLLAFLAWRFRRLRSASGSKSASATRPSWPGQDSEWYAVEAGLAAMGWDRRDGEPRASWRLRLAEAARDDGFVERLAAANAWHERLRFDPRGLAPLEREGLRQTAATLLGELTARPAASIPMPDADATTA